MNVDSRLAATKTIASLAPGRRRGCRDSPSQGRHSWSGRQQSKQAPRRTGAEEQDDLPKLRRQPSFRAKIIPAAAQHRAFPSIPELGLVWAEYMSWLGFLYIAEGKICSSFRRSTARSPLFTLVAVLRSVLPSLSYSRNFISRHIKENFTT